MVRYRRCVGWFNLPPIVAYLIVVVVIVVIIVIVIVLICRCPGAAPSVPLRLHDLPSRLSSAAPGRLRLAPGGRTPHLRQELSIYPAAASTRTPPRIFFFFFFNWDLP